MLLNKQFKSIIMSKFFKPKSILGLFLIAILAFSCSSDDNSDISIPPPGDDDPVSSFDAELFVSSAGGDMREVTVSADGSTGMEITSKVQFTNATANMRRLYITESVNGGASEPFVFTSQEVDEKPDGSLDLVGDDKENFEFQINLPAPMAEGESIVYTFWVTNGRGDFRDISKRNAIDDTTFGTITVNFGTPTMDPGSLIRQYDAVVLKAPLSNAASETFMSLFNGEKYQINQGEETAALWDLGFYWLNQDGVSLASTADYRDDIVDVPAASGIPLADLNKTYFAISSATVTDFDAITTSAEIDAIVIATPTSQRVNQLAIGDIVEVVDQYGNKGLIRIDDFEPSFGSDGFIEMTIKMQS